MLNNPHDVLDAWATAWNAGDAKALAAIFTEDADFVNVVGLWWHDKEAIQKAHAYGFEKIFTGSTVAWRNDQIRNLGPDVAVIQARWSVSGQLPYDGIEAGVRHGVFTFVMQRFETGWLCVTAQNTDIVPGVETHIATPDGIKSADYRTQ